jgi:alpha-tubulin suppressor-like RCC1 family protein
VSWGVEVLPQFDRATGYVAISAGGSHTLALRQEGTIAAWGYNWFGETNVPAGLSNVVAVAAADRHSLALKGP